MTGPKSRNHLIFLSQVLQFIGDIIKHLTIWDDLKYKLHSLHELHDIQSLIVNPSKIKFGLPTSP